MRMTLILDIDNPQGMVYHPAPGHSVGTLVNALLTIARALCPTSTA